MKDQRNGRLDMSDIQGLILRGYRMSLVRHFVLAVRNPAAARGVLRELVDRDGDGLQVTSAALWPDGEKPAYCLNVGLTFKGIERLEVVEDPEESFRSFTSFRQGAVKRAEFVGDTGASAPEHWTGQLASPEVDVLVCLHCEDSGELKAQSDRLRELFASRGAFEELSSFDGSALPDGKVHFGYKDGISQPTIRGAFPRKPDMQPEVNPDQFLILEGGNYNVPTPGEIGLNGSFAAFRVLEQDVVGFERFLQSNADTIDPEILAAKLCGRWRDGVPLELSPDAPQSDPPIPELEYSDFDYVPTQLHPDIYDDSSGLRCPIGSHTRRTNPRSQPVPAAGLGHEHRIIRRGMPYGPEFVPGADKNEHAERGLLGLFICSDLFNQFEFLMSTWINGSTFAADLLADSQDPLLGANIEDSSQFEIPDSDGNIVVEGFQRFVNTRGAAYVFFPSVTALRYMASVKPVG